MGQTLVGEWSRLLATSLAQAGLGDAVLCPGSRSTPFACALAETPGIRSHSLIDERAAAFFALGLARVTGRPALVLSTSGSAAANFFPAVVEASLARVPLLVLTADRPLEVQSAEAAQTIDQVKLYGDYVRRFFDLGAPEPLPGVLAGLQRTLVQALALTLAPEPGPVHLNARARKPLEPATAETDPERERAAAVSVLVERGATRVVAGQRAAPPEAIRELAAAISQARRGLIVCGPLPVHAESTRAALRTLAERSGLPLFAEATSGLRFDAAPSPAGVDALELLLRSRACRSALAPELILRFGGTPTTSTLEPLLAEHPGAELHVIAEHGHPDASGRARTLTQAPLDAVASALSNALAGEPSDAQRAFTEAVREAGTRAWQVVGRVLEGEPAAGEPRVVRAAVESVPSGGLLIVGNSLPVRLVDAFVPAGARGVRVASQRGANGIDGLVAGAAGSALATGDPTLLLLGDVSLAHDLGGLAAARLVKSPFVVLVVDNGGGRIFDQLPVAKLYAGRPERAELWLTPPRLELEHAGPLFGIPYAAPASIDELRAALRQAFAHAGATLVHVRVAPQSAQLALQNIKAELDREGPSWLGRVTPTSKER